MADASRAWHQLIMIPEADLAVWGAQTSVTEATPTAGQPVATSTTQLALTASGDQAEAIRVRTQTPGLPALDPEGARLIRRNEAGTDWYGWDPPRAPSTMQPVLWNDSDITALDTRLDAVTTVDEYVLVCVELQDTGAVAQHRLEVLQFVPSTATWNRVAVETGGATFSPDPCPTMCVLPSGRVHLYRLLNGVSHDHLRLWYSDDNGSTWSHGGDAVFFGNTTSRLRCAYQDGQLAMVQRASGGCNLLASSDDGHTWDLVGTLGLTAPADFDICERPGGGFLIATIGRDATNGVDVLILADAYQDPDVAQVVSLPTEFADITTDEDVTIWVDGNGVVHCIARDGDETFAAVSFDAGATWQTYLESSTTGDVLNYRSTGNCYPENFVATPVGGRVALVAKQSSSGSATTPAGELLVCYWMGGWTTATTPSGDAFLGDQDAQGWTGVWYPVEQPDSYSGWTRATTGTPTRSFENLAYKVVSTTLNYESYAGPAMTVGNAAVRFTVKQTGGALATSDAALRVRLSTCEFTVNLAGSSGFRLVDSAGTVGSVAVDLSAAAYQIWVEVESSTRAFILRYRLWGHGEDRAWTTGLEGTLTSSSPGSQEVTWGNIAAPSGGGTTAWWYEVVWADSDSRLVSGAANTSNPTDLRGRLYAGTPYVGKDVRLQARHGPSYRGEEWTIDTAAQYALDNAISNPSPRVPWRSTSTAAQTIALQWSDNTTVRPTSVLGILLRGSNVPTVTVDAYDGSWNTLASSQDLTIGGLSYTRIGDAVKPNTGGTANPLFRHAELQGGTFALSGSTARRIARHTEGLWNSTASLQPVLRLTDVDNGADPTSGVSAAVIPDQVLLLIPISADYSAIRLVIPQAAGNQAPAESYWQIGTLKVGWCYPVGQVTSWGRSMTLELPAEAVETRDRQQRVVQVAPPLRRLSMSWVDGIDQTPVEEDDPSTEPDHVGLGTAAGAYERGTAYTMEGLWREVHGQLGEVVWAQRVETLSGVQVLKRRRDALHGRAGSPDLVFDTAQGDEGASEVVRVTEVLITELP